MVGAISTRPGDRPDIVLSQDPAAGVAVATGTAVALTIAVRPPDQQVAVPDVFGAMLDEAWRLVENRGLVRGRIGFRDDAREGRVLAQEPQAGTPVERGSAVHLTIGRQAVSERTRVPDLNDRTFAEARAALVGARLQLGGVIGPQDGRVIKQTEEAGSDVPVGTSVAITLAKAGAPPTGDDYCKRLAAAMAARPDCEVLGIKAKELSAMLSKAEITDAESAKGLAELAEADLQKKLELKNRKLARDFKSVLRAALERL